MKRAPRGAFAGYLPAGLFALALGVANLVPMDTGTAGGVGLLVLVPLALLSLVTLPRAAWASWKHREDGLLLSLAYSTVAALAILLIPVPAWLKNVLLLAYAAWVGIACVLALRRPRT